MLWVMGVCGPCWTGGGPCAAPGECWNEGNGCDCVSGPMEDVDWHMEGCPLRTTEGCGA